jgi:hydroxyacylglutathione hydrolase
MNKETRVALVIDAGPESYALITEESKKNGVIIEGLIITHPHWDHILDIHLFRKDGIPVYAHREAVHFIEDPSSQMSIAMPGTEFIPGKVDHIVAHGDILTMAGFEIEIREAPGHCPGSIIINFSVAGCCFTGDVIFDGSVGRTDLPGGNMQALKESIRGQVYTLPDETILYPGHGSSSLVGKEKISNPFVTE